VAAATTAHLLLLLLLLLALTGTSIPFLSFGSK
jgi:hypothetical protein